MTSPNGRPFSEREFYLQEFGGRTLGIAVPDDRCVRHGALGRVLTQFAEVNTRVVLVVPQHVDTSSLDGADIAIDTPRLEGAVWRALRKHPHVVVRATAAFSDACRESATRLGLFKFVRLADRAGIRDEAGRRRSFVHLAELEQLEALAAHSPVEPQLLQEIRTLLAAGVPNVNLCTVEGLDAELFSYSGSGTLFTRERYVEVRGFGIEDYDAANDLIARGTNEGYLAPRSEAQLDALLADGFGAFVEGTHLAGIGALRVVPGGVAGEVASLYTLTRFAGGGIGGHLVNYAVAQAGRQGLRYVYACTTLDRVAAFFERQGFSAAQGSEVPAEKWEGYDAARRARVRCFRTDL